MISKISTVLCGVDRGLGWCPSHPQRVTRTGCLCDSSAVIAPTSTSTVESSNLIETSCCLQKYHQKYKFNLYLIKSRKMCCSWSDE